MSPQNLMKQVRALRFQRNIVVGVAVLMIVANALLAFASVNQSNQVILIPSTVSDGMVARGKTDMRYTEALAKDVIFAFYNSSPQNLEYGRNTLERLAAATQRAKILTHYDKVAKDIRERKISTVFFINKMEHHHDKLEIIVTGTLRTYLNAVPISVEPRRVSVKFKPEAGSVRFFGITKLETE